MPENPDQPFRDLLDTLEHPWRDETVLRKMYIEMDMTIEEIANEFGVSMSTVSNWLQRNQIADSAPDPADYDISPTDTPNNVEKLRGLYLEENLSTNQIAALFECSQTTIYERLQEAGIKFRDLSTAQSYISGSPFVASYDVDKHGVPCWKQSNHRVQVHRLLAVSEYGLDEIKGKFVHHKNGIRWDNRPENLELLDHDDHFQRYRKIRGEEREKIANRYENEDVSTRELAEEFDISPPLVLDIHSEYFG